MGLKALESLGPVKAFCGMITIVCLYGLLAGLLTTYWGPGAAGSGVAELIGYLNGVDYKDFLGFKTLITKIFGVILAVNARLCVGKEGPLAHIGANLGAMVLYIPGLGFEFLRNDDKKRQFICAGAAVGISAAFGAPIGGTLFCFELSKTNTFWKFSMLYKVFFACCTGSFCLGLEKHLAERFENNNRSDFFASIDGFKYQRVRSESDNITGVLDMQDIQLSHNNYANAIANTTKVIRPRDDNANFETTLEKLVTQQVINDYRTHLIRYEGKLYNLQKDPVGLNNKVWINFGANVLREPVSCYIDSMTYSLKRNAYKVVMHIPNQNDDETSEFKVTF